MYYKAKKCILIRNSKVLGFQLAQLVSAIAVSYIGYQYASFYCWTFSTADCIVHVASPLFSGLVIFPIGALICIVRINPFYAYPMVTRFAGRKELFIKQILICLITATESTIITLLASGVFGYLKTKNMINWNELQAYFAYMTSGKTIGLSFGELLVYAFLFLFLNGIAINLVILLVKSATNSYVLSMCAVILPVTLYKAKIASPYSLLDISYFAWKNEKVSVYGALGSVGLCLLLMLWSRKVLEQRDAL